MQFVAKKIDSALVSKIERAALSQSYNLNGNYLRPVYGSLYKSELRHKDLYSLKPIDLDERQRNLLSSVGNLSELVLHHTGTVKTIEVKSLLGGRSLLYKASATTTYAMEELLETKQLYGGQVNHLVMQLEDSVALDAQASKHDFESLKQRISRALRRACPLSRGFFVLERCEQSWTDKVSRKKPSLHLHVAMYTPYEFSFTERNRVKRSFRHLMRNKRANNALVANAEKTICRVNIWQPSGVSKTFRALDMGLADYLCKELDNPIVKRCSNLSLFGMGNLVYTRYKWRYKQLQAMRAEISNIERDALCKVPIGDVHIRLSIAVQRVDRPKALLPPPYSHKSPAAA